MKTELEIRPIPQAVQSEIAKMGGEYIAHWPLQLRADGSPVQSLSTNRHAGIDQRILVKNLSTGKAQVMLINNLDGKNTKRFNGRNEYDFVKENDKVYVEISSASAATVVKPSGYAKPLSRPSVPKLEQFPNGTDQIVQAKRRLERDQWVKVVWYDCDGKSLLTGGSLLLEAVHLVDRRLLTDTERLDPAAGILLESQYNTAMEKRLIWFENDGTIVMKQGFEEALQFAGIHFGKLSRITPEMVPYISRHREICLNTK